MPDHAPTLDDVANAAASVIGRRPDRIDRFTTGSGHYVFEAGTADGASIVVRMGTPDRRQALAQGLDLQRRLRDLGVPLPEILGHDFRAEWPWVAMERLAGTDLGDVIAEIDPAQLQAIAERVAGAQSATARLGVAARYGYAPNAASAPSDSWTDVVASSLACSRKRLAANAIFDTERVMAPLEALLVRHTPQLDAIAATPFLHDTTTRNVIIAADGTFSGIVDVDDLCFGDPRYAPALTRAVLLTYGGPLPYVDVWMRAAGHSDDAAFKFYIALFIADLMAEQGMAFNGNETPPDLERNKDLQAAYRQALAEIGL